jgi:hypothetical protein
MSGDAKTIEQRVQDVMWLVFDYARIMDGSEALVGPPRAAVLKKASDKDKEIRAAILAVTEASEELRTVRDLLTGLMGLIVLVSSRDDFPYEVTVAMLNNHRYVDALRYIESLPDDHPRELVQDDYDNERDVP